MSSTQSSQGGKGGQKANSPMPSSDRKSNEDIDSLVDHLRSIEGVDEDIAMKIAENWQRLLGVMVIILVAVWLFGSYRQTQASKIEEASNVFVEAQGAYRSLPSKATAGEEESKKISDSLAKIDANLRLVTESYPDSIYNDLGPIYKALGEARAGDKAKAFSALEPFAEAARANGRYSAQVGITKKRFVDELGAFVLAKLLIEEPERAEEGIALLTELAKNSAVVAPEAVVSLLRIADTDEQMTTALTTARAVMDSRPELAAVIAREIQSQGLEAPVNQQATVVQPAQPTS